LAVVNRSWSLFLAAEIFSRCVQRRFVVDAEGVKQAVILDYSVWEPLLTLLEDAEGAEEISRLRQADEETLSWDEAKAESPFTVLNIVGVPLTHDS